MQNTVKNSRDVYGKCRIMCFLCSVTWNWCEPVIVRTSSIFVPTTTSRTSSISAIIAMRSTLTYATSSSNPPFSTSPSTCLRRSYGSLTSPACTTNSTPPITAKRWVHRDPRPSQHVCSDTMIIQWVSRTDFCSSTCKKLRYRCQPFVEPV